MRSTRVFTVAVAALCTAAVAEPRTSATQFLPPELRAQQADDGANPGMLWVERGEKLWRAPDGPKAASCSGCHGDAVSSMPSWASSHRPIIASANSSSDIADGVSEPHAPSTSAAARPNTVSARLFISCFFLLPPLEGGPGTAPGRP